MSEQDKTNADPTADPKTGKDEQPERDAGNPGQANATDTSGAGYGNNAATGGTGQPGG